MEQLVDLLKECTPLDPIPTGLEARTPKLTGIRAVIFDIYGTLFISGSGDISLASEFDREEAFRDVLRLEGISASTGESLSDRFNNLIAESHESARQTGADFPEVEIREIWKSLLQPLGGDVVSDSSLIGRVALRFENRVNPVWPMPGLAETLQQLSNRPETALGIVSNAQFYTPLLFQHFLGKPYSELGFERNLCIWSFEEGVAKPSQSLFRKLCDTLMERKILPEQAVYVGNDMRNDITTASAAGMRTALFAGDERSLRLRDHPPDQLPCDLILTDLRQILPSLEA